MAANSNQGRRGVDDADSRIAGETSIPPRSQEKPAAADMTSALASSLVWSCCGE